MDVQQDGSSCGFWASTIALLIVFKIEPSSDDSKEVLRKLGANGLKTLWRAIMENYLSDSVGLQASVLHDFLCKFPDWEGFPDGIECVGLLN